MSVDQGSPKNENNQSNDCPKCGFLITTVHDTGIGIPKEKHAEIFTIFSQVEKEGGGILTS
jgi:signal transduction histidine kinase